MTRICFLQKKLAGHPHVINFISASCNDRGGGSKEYLVVTELCSGNSFHCQAVWNGVILNWLIGELQVELCLTL